MPCRYHPADSAPGQCVECHRDYCTDCAVPIVRHGMLCIDCGARFARKKLGQSYFAMGLGALAGLAVGGQASFWLAVPAAVLYAYVFAAIFFGYHFGGKIWVQLGKLADKFNGAAGFMAAIVFLSVRIATAMMLGVFGGGVVQFLRYRKLVEYQRSLMTSSAATATMQA